MLPTLLDRAITLDPILRELTDAQRTAVQVCDGPLLILAGPGSGKTRVVTHRIAYLISQGIAARQILALTFTNKAAEQMQRRLDALAPGQPVWVGTFHRFCARLLRRYAPLVGLSANYTIYDQSDSRRALKRVLEEQGVASYATARQIGPAISRAKNQLVLPDDYQPDPDLVWGQIVGQIYPHYQARLIASSAVDFDDLLLHVATLMRENPDVRADLDTRYRYVLVDEYQDTNRAQYVILRGLSSDYPNLAATGDPDQSIYGWRGADLNNILDFEKDFAGVRVVRLEQNWRSTKRILRVADQLISFNRRRKKKTLTTDNPEGHAVRIVLHASEAVEGEAIATRIADWVERGERRASDIAIFYRINALSRAIESGLRERGIPYQLVRGVAFYQRKEIKDVVAYALLVNNPQDDVALLRAINTPPRGIGKVTQGRLQAYASGHRLTLWQAAGQVSAVPGISRAMAGRVTRFVQQLERIMKKAVEPVHAVFAAIVSETEYFDYLGEDSDEPDVDRVANVDELLNDAAQFDEDHPGGGQLEAFLERAQLVSDTDDWDQATDQVTLMTLHAAKGLEFPAVFIVGLEEGLLPHERSRQDPESLEEERRLLFVGITRAAEQLELSLTVSRHFRGTQRRSVPSSFLMELPRAEMDVIGLPGWMNVSPDVMPPRSASRTDRPVCPRGRTGVGEPAKLTTAADLASLSGSPAAGRAADCDPDEFADGMTVVHPEFGPGKVVNLAGSGAARKATIAFATAGRKIFILAKSPLRPVGCGGGG